MRSSLALVVLVLFLLSILAGCAPSPNQLKGTASEHDGVAGFWLGLWQGFKVHNNGALYNFGYLLGLACFFGGSGNRAAAMKCSRPAGGTKQ